MDKATPSHEWPCISSAEALVPALMEAAADHDAEGRFVARNFAALKAAGLASAAVPVELGGKGAQVRELAGMLRVLARGCGPTALAFAMHTHLVATPAWRWQNRPETRPALEPLLRRIATEGLILATSGGSDWVGGAGRAEKAEGGYRIFARKVFASSAPVADLFMTSAVLDDAGARTVLHFALPMTAPGLVRHDTWDTLGMRGTGSFDIELDGVFVAEERIAARRPAGEWHPLFQIIAMMALPLVYAVYLGLAETAATRALALAGRRLVDGRLRRLAGEMETRLSATRLAHEAMLAEAEGDDPGPETVNRIMIGRRLVEEAAIRTVDLAMELAGGPAFYRAAGMERLFRDVQAARYHPMGREAQFEYAGALALGQPVATVF